MSDERQIASWSKRPYTGVGKRHIRVDHRVVAEWFDGVGMDIRHQIRCPERDEPNWKDIGVWEYRDHGVTKHSAGRYKEVL